MENKIILTEEQEVVKDKFFNEFEKAFGIIPKLVTVEENPQDVVFKTEKKKDPNQVYSDEFYDIVKSYQKDHREFVEEMSDNGSSYEVSGRVWMFVQLAKLACKIDGIDIKNN